MPRVYVCHHDGLRERPLDLSDAERFGALRVVLGREIFPDDVDTMVPASINRARMILADFNPEEDFLLLVGSPLHIAICVAIIGATHLQFRVLRYDRVHRGYYPVDIDITAAAPAATAEEPGGLRGFVDGFSRS